MGRDRKDLIWILANVDWALKLEREKFKQVPIKPDLMPQYIALQGWGYVVVGYNLLEQGLKGILVQRPSVEPNGHDVKPLFDMLTDGQKEVLSRVYDDFLENFVLVYYDKPESDSLRSQCPDVGSYLANLDGGKGSVGWRYFLVEECWPPPKLSVDVLHEIVHGCVLLLEQLHNGLDPYEHLYSRRVARSESRRRWREKVDEILREHGGHVVIPPSGHFSE